MARGGRVESNLRLIGAEVKLHICRVGDRISVCLLSHNLLLVGQVSSIGLCTEHLRLRGAHGVRSRNIQALSSRSALEMLVTRVGVDVHAAILLRTGPITFTRLGNVNPLLLAVLLELIICTSAPLIPDHAEEAEHDTGHDCHYDTQHDNKPVQ